MNASVATQKRIRKLHRRVFERIKKSKWKNFVNLCELNNFQTQVIDRTLFPVESRINIKIKITRHRVAESTSQ